MAATSQLAFATPPLRVASPNDYVKTHETLVVAQFAQFAISSIIPISSAKSQT